MSPIETFASQAQLDHALADTIAQHLSETVAQYQSATLALSGGQTPQTMLRCLSQQSLPWSAVQVTLVDERWVDEQHSDSNGAMVQRTLLQGPAAAAQFIPWYNGQADLLQAQAQLAQRLSNLPGPLSVTVLGMGLDGHTASLFAQSPQYAAAMDRQQSLPCIAMQMCDAAYPRMTLTLAQIVRSRWLMLHITGQAKLELVHQALAQAQQLHQQPQRLHDDRVWPISRVLHQRWLQTQQPPSADPAHALHIFWAP